jgi:hypothetical protein
LKPEGRIFLEGLGILIDSSDQPARRRFLEEVSRGFQRASGPSDSDVDPIDLLQQSSVPSLVAIAGHLAGARESSPNLDTLLGGVASRFGDASWQADAAAIGQLWLDYRSGTNAQARSIRGFLRHVARAQLSKPSDPGIRILTIHRVKGLEFRAVAVVGVREGALPDYRATSSRQIEAERRGLYVAMTRAQRALHLSWPRTTTDRWNRKHQQQPSRFLTAAQLIQSQ